jgi:cytochrome c biogenesis protein CcmG/thiol:disulfide interchange protein DsbE
VTGHRARWIALGVGVVVVAFGIVLATQHRTEASMPRLVQEHRAAPAFSAKAVDGTPVTSAALKGKTYVVNVWNTWCIPCQQEEPALRAFYERHGGEPDFAMVGLVRDDNAKAVNRYVDSKRVTWPIVFDDRLLTAFGTTGQPETYVIAPDGRAVCGRIGATSLDELEQWLQVARAGETCA